MCIVEMTPTGIDSGKLCETLRSQALDLNDKSVSVWSKYKTDLEVTKSLLSLLPQKMKHDILVPIGPRALMPGTIVHTNEFLVNLGETWFAKRTAFQTTEICNRRVKSCNEMLDKLEKERQLIITKSCLPVEQEAFGTEDRSEIIEYVTEEEDKEWRKQHRIKEKKYRQQLAELRNKEKKPIENEEDLWKHLDELELQEELQDELNRLNAEYNSDDEISDQDSLQELANSLETDSKQENKSNNVKKAVTFACDIDSSDDEPLRLEIKHSNFNPVSRESDSKNINSPSDIFNCYLKIINKEPLSVLKHKVHSCNKNIAEIVKNDITVESDEEELVEGNSVIPVGIRLNDVCERHTLSSESVKIVDTNFKKVSKFKSSRVKHF